MSTECDNHARERGKEAGKLKVIFICAKHRMNTLVVLSVYTMKSSYDKIRYKLHTVKGQQREYLES